MTQARLRMFVVDSQYRFPLFPLAPDTLYIHASAVGLGEIVSQTSQHTVVDKIDREIDDFESRTRRG